MTNQLDKQHENLTWQTLTTVTPALEVEKGTTVLVQKGDGEWLGKHVKVIRVTLQTPYSDAQYTLCEGEMGWGHLSYVVDNPGYEDRAEVLAMKVLGNFSVKEILSMMRAARQVGVEDGMARVRNDIKRLLHI